MRRARKSQPIGGLSIAKYNGISMIIPLAWMRMIKHKKRLREAALDNVANQRAVQIQDGTLVPIYAAGKVIGKTVYPAPRWSQRK